MLSWFRNRRRRHLLAEPFPARFTTIIDRNVAHYPLLTLAQQARVKEIAQVLIGEKSWEGGAGLYVTEEMKVTIAAQAALLLLGIEHDHYSRVTLIKVYPTTFHTPVSEDDWEDDGLSETDLAGQAIYRGPVILNWEEVLAEGREPDLGSNVVLHEFAHQLDFLDNQINGTPLLPSREMELRWAEVMTPALSTHRAALASGVETFFTEHAGDDESEFFADATELFYCLPHELRSLHPNLYDLLQGYYRVEPTAWFSPPSGLESRRP